MGADLTVLARQQKRGTFIGDRMWLTNIAAERTTAATDLLLAAVALMCLLGLRPLKPRDPWRAGVWGGQQFPVS